MKDRCQIDTAIQPIGMWAVFRHTSKIKSAHFRSLHYTQDSAIKEAERLTALTIEQYGTEKPACFYVIKIEARAGLIDGRLISEKL